MDIVKIDKFDQYLNCRKNQIFSYLAAKNLPVDLLLYNAYENSDDVYQNVFEKRIHRYLYLEKTLPEADLNLLGVSTFMYPTSSFDIVDELLPRLIDSHQVVFLYGAAWYLDYKQNTYQKVEIVHSIPAFAYEEKPEGRTYKIFDDVFDGVQRGQEFMHYDISHKVMKEYIENQGTEGGVNVLAKDRMTIFDFSTLREKEAKEAFQAKYANWLENFNDDFAVYTKIPGLLQDESIIQSFADAEAFHEIVFHLLSTLVGSRNHFLRFIQYTNPTSELIPVLQETVAAIEAVRFVANKFRFSGKLDVKRITDKANAAKAKETEFLELLNKQKYASVFA
ncbi:hypothetical protein PaecuDRAFT_1208 [Paenibacillus curdlanolyticus YK9]|uniref:Butirosin biosynthesis protein H N-terminal domain-containing protein n=1 Tax=Paenibacillus curdlanolyticus YK9 TaxID=717606 RepID=E0I6D6_9BACL|nr:hypothetical protein [Paenibacillus curdlanolyticus]EFM11602.1 hypothetical protein PaecuDRAFT_1208 [Paenibacillus curdlanolyticus YK9]